MSAAFLKEISRFVIVSWAMVLASGAACRQTPGRSDDAVIASLNDEEIRESDFIRYHRLNTPEDLEFENQAREDIFREFLIQRLLLQQAEKEGIQIPNEQVEEELNRWLADDAGRQEESWRQQVRDFLTVQSLIRRRIETQSRVNPEEIEKYYQENEEEFIVDDRIHVREILVDSREKATDIRARLKAGRLEDFVREAMAHSIGVTASAGGDLGTFERGELPEEFERIVFGLLPGEVSAVFESSHGFHLFVVEEKIRRHSQRLSEVADLIFERLVGEKERAALDQYEKQLLQSASIEIYDQDLQSAWRKINANSNP